MEANTEATEISIYCFIQVDAQWKPAGLWADDNKDESIFVKQWLLLRTEVCVHVEFVLNFFKRCFKKH